MCPYVQEYRHSDNTLTLYDFNRPIDKASIAYFNKFDCFTKTDIEQAEQEH